MNFHHGIPRNQHENSFQSSTFQLKPKLRNDDEMKKKHSESQHQKQYPCSACKCNSNDFLKQCNSLSIDT